MTERGVKEDDSGEEGVCASKDFGSSPDIRVNIDSLPRAFVIEVSKKGSAGGPGPPADSNR